MCQFFNCFGFKNLLNYELFLLSQILFFLELVKLKLRPLAKTNLIFNLERFWIKIVARLKIEKKLKFRYNLKTSSIWNYFENYENSLKLFFTGNLCNPLKVRKIFLKGQNSWKYFVMFWNSWNFFKSRDFFLIFQNHLKFLQFSKNLLKFVEMICYLLKFRRISRNHKPAIFKNPFCFIIDWNLFKIKIMFEFSQIL